VNRLRKYLNEDEEDMIRKTWVKKLLRFASCFV